MMMMMMMMMTIIIIMSFEVVGAVPVLYPSR
jgi:hypothetical protein